MEWHQWIYPVQAVASLTGIVALLLATWWRDTFLAVIACYMATISVSAQLQILATQSP